MRKHAVPFVVLAMVFASSLWAQGGDPNYKPKRINKMIELLEAGQPVYDISVSEAGYDEGKKLAQAHYDLIQYQMEHGPFNPALLREFMRGLVDGGPTKSGHRTPTVIVDLPVLGLDENTVRANHWVIEQVLSAGVHGLMLCHARTPEAVKAFISAARYPFEREGLQDDMIPEGLRGSGSQGFASGIWGISGAEYLERADPWPMNPDGEFILSLKLEDKYSLANVEQIAVIPGIAWAEWGPGDQAMSLKGLEYLKGGGSAEAHGQGNAPPVTNALGLPALPDAELEAARTRIFSALKANNIFILHSSSSENLEQLIKAGIMVTHAGGSTEVSNMGRAYTKRQMPY